MRQFHLFVVAALAFAVASPAHADSDGLKERYTKKRRIIKSGTIAKLKARKVKVAGRGKMTIEKLADEALVRPRDRAAQLRKAEGAVFGKVTETEEMIETDAATILISTVRARIKDPVKLRKADAFKGYGKKKRARVKLDKFTADQTKALEELRAELQNEPEDDPLRQASDESDQALLDAMSDGQGTIEVITTFVIPMEAPVMTDGGILLSMWAAAGGFDDATQELIPASALYPPPSIEANVYEASGTTRTGSRTNTHKFLLGRSIGDKWVWSEQYSFPGATATVSAGAEYGFGLRIPVVVTTTVDPTRIETVAVKDHEKKYNVEVSAKTKDAGPDFYEEVGVPSDAIGDGKELMIYAKVWAGIDGKTSWWLGSIPFHAYDEHGFDFGDDFTPALGSCNTSCGAELWIPSTVTQTGFDLGVVRGGVEFGFNVSGHGEFTVDYRSKIGTNDKKSTFGGNERTKHKLEFDREETHTMHTTVRALTVQNNELDFGYQLDNPHYVWDMRVTPGLRGDITVDVGVWDHTFNLGPWFLDAMAFDIGTLELGADRETTTSYTRKPGTKTWRKPEQVPLGQ